MSQEIVLEEIIAGPILRRLSSNQLVLWWVSPQQSRGKFQCYINDEVVLDVDLTECNTSKFKVGAQAIVHLLDIEISLPVDQYIEYDLLLETDDGIKHLRHIIPTLMFDNKTRPSFIIQPNITNMLHGSCRNPHAKCDDSLLAGEQLLAKSLENSEKRPALLMMSGDQIYADHVAGPTLYGIHQVIEILGLNTEEFEDEVHSDIKVSKELHQLSEQYYRRTELLPKTKLGASWYRKGAEQTIFTSTAAHNHLMSFAEVMAMYLLIWSPTLWRKVSLTGLSIPTTFEMTYQDELKAITTFVEGLPQVQRLLAHIPTYMIFDDHDVTDDWNLTGLWEQAAYNNSLAKRIIGNTLIGYWLCQGWGNDPKQFEGEFLTKVRAYSDSPNKKNHDSFISEVLNFSKWQYHLETIPKLVVVDSRTRRWQNDEYLDNPSGLMDWEAMCELQQELIGEYSVILVSPAPIFGVKIIETIQKIATMCGKPLAVDAENWMAHSECASTMLNIFKHPKTPQHFVILSGDVHYSFVYDIELRFRDHSPQIWQVTSSGIKNKFPEPLIGYLDHINRWLYGSYSPLNLLTKRRSMKIKGRNVVNGGNRRLVSKSGLGYLEFNDDGSPSLICDVHNDGSITEFVESDEEIMP